MFLSYKMIVSALTLVVITRGDKKPPPKLCKDCTYFKRNFLTPDEFGLCTFSKNLNLVTGDATYPDASIYREFYCKEQYFVKSKNKFFE